VRCILSLFFFFQAEDGIRDVAVTGVQTCALPILREALAARCTLQISPIVQRAARASRSMGNRFSGPCAASRTRARAASALSASRSEERRVGKEGGGRGAAGVCERGKRRA